MADHMANLFDSYEDLMALDLPFARPLKSLMRGGMTGDENDFDIKGEHTMERPIAIVESVERLDIGKVAFGHRFWRDAPDTPKQKEDKQTGAKARAMNEHMSQEISWQVERGGGLPQKRKTFGPR